jgi:transcriptional regulator with XRE-family HTH domain
MHPDRRAQIQDWLRERRKTQQWLAAQIGISPVYLSLILRGHRSPSLRVAVRLERVSGLSAVEFLASPPAPVTDPDQPSGVINCSLDGFDPPWMWSWGGGFVPFWLMRET